MNLWPATAIFLFATKVGFFTGYLLIASMIGLGIDALLGKVSRIFLPLTVTFLALGTIKYYYDYSQERVTIRNLENELREKNEKSIDKIISYISESGERPVPIETEYQQFSRYNIDYYYSKFYKNNSRKSILSENIYLRQKHCNIIKENSQHLSLKKTSIKDLSAEGGYMCILRAEISAPDITLEKSTAEIIHYKTDDNEIKTHVYRTSIILGEKISRDYLTASVKGLPSIPAPFVICGNFGGYMKTPKYFCSISLQRFDWEKLDTRPKFAIADGTDDAIAMILGLKPRDFFKFPDHEMSQRAERALSTHLPLEAKSELLDATQEP